ncbi:MAG TPA: SMP-30/gluconolactonase/LRE family protein [Ramlibacter sp.]|nr:SMP-30/gluconolactonase/LRE family protein [Ramlibacter sp.]
MSATLRIEPIGSTRDLLGESPLWDERQQALYWIDARQRLVRRLDPASGALRQWTLPQDIGSIALVDGGSLLVALEDGFHRLDLASGECKLLAAVTHPAAHMRLNDGRTDRAGRFLCGSMALGRREEVGVLYQLRTDGGAIALREIDHGFSTSNTTCFSPDGRWLYFSDSHANQVWRYPYDTVTGQVLGPREPFIAAQLLGSAPDGATVDADGGLWIAMVLTGELARFDERGRLDLRLPTGLPYVSCPCIGGPALDTLYLTTIRNSGNLLKTDHPDAGALLAIHGTGVRGLPEVRFAVSEELQ